MLFLTRKAGEEIVIPTCDLTLKVLQVGTERVRLGIEAPPRVTVHREELKRRIAENETMNETKRTIQVLIAAPDKYLLAEYREGLSRTGFEVAVAADGLECLECLRGARPDVLVLDPALPWGGGDGVLAMMHEDPDLPIVPVIVLAAGNDRGVLYRLGSFPIHGFCTRPMQVERLAEEIRRIVASVARRPDAKTVGAGR